MKDIDFDELDRAVSSLMGSVPKDKPAEAADGPSVASDDTAVVIDEPEQSDNAVTPDVNSFAAEEDDPTPVSIPEPTDDKQPEPEKPSSPTVTRPASRGRFMDVVRPSRDVRKSSLSLSRQGVTLQPSAAHQSAEAVVPKERASYQSEEASSDLGIPGELEDTTDAAATLNDRDISGAPLSVGESNMNPGEDNTPLDSPFLPDAKVEKRPLGRPAELTPLVNLEDELVEGDNPAVESFPVIEERPVTSSQDTDAQLPQDPLPAELDSKLLGIETDTTMATAIATEPEQASSTQAPAAEIASPSEGNRTASTPPAIDVPRAMAAASIPQQYKLENKVSEEAPAGAIYDTQPLAHPAKSKSGWLWIAGILGILILGAALGAGVYYLGLL